MIETVHDIDLLTQAPSQQRSLAQSCDRWAKILLKLKLHDMINEVCISLASRIASYLLA